MSIQWNGTFRVGRSKFVSSKFNFSSSRAASPVRMFSSAQDMWDGLIWKNNDLSSRLTSDLQGDATKAKEMQDIFNSIAQGDYSDLTFEERNLIFSIYGLIDGYDYAQSNQRGMKFEEKVAKLINYLFDSLDMEDIRLGQSSVSTATFSTTVELGEKSASELKSIIMEDLNRKTQKLVDDVVIRLGQEWEDADGRRYAEALIRSSLRQGKIDLQAGSSENIALRSEMSPKMQRLGELIRGKTFSLKNYTSFNIHLGDANPFRSLASFYYYSTKDSSFVNVCTFIYSSKNSHKPAVKSYISVARFIYELTGAGQSNGRLVDYLMALVRVNPYGLPVMEIRSTKELVQQAISNRYNFSFSGNLLLT